MISGKLQVVTNPLDALEVFLADFNDMVADIGNAVTQEVETPFLDELRYTPPAVVYPIQWTSEKQRRAFFATDGFGRGIPTRRTGKMQNAWRVIGITKDGKYQLVVSNPVAYLPYVVGSLDFRSRNRALVPMQRFHQNTGWQPAIDTVSFWFDVAEERFNTRYQKQLQEFTKRKAITRTSRKG